MTTATLAPPTAPESRLSDFTDFALRIQQRLPADEVVVLTTMPRGGLQVCRCQHLHEGVVRRYVTELHKTDVLAWRALREGEVGGADIAAGQDTPIAQGLVTTLALRVESPVFDGYPGVVMVLRKAGSPAIEFDATVEAAEVRRAFDLTLRAARQSQGAAEVGKGIVKQYVFDADGNDLLPHEQAAAADPQVLAGIRELITRGAADGRHGVPDGRGTHVAVEVMRFESYPALSQQPVVFVSIHPEVSDWATLRPEGFEADPELARLTRAVAFMVAEFQNGPTLESIAQAVQLSQFHFHRRFSELFGVTPKHLLYDLQLHEAKRLLADPRQQLASIAKHCGFAHQSHFTSRFKQGAGVTPTRWRRQMLEVQDG